VTTRAVEPITDPLNAAVRLPGSKSLTNRALLCAALAQGESVLDGVLFAEDTEAMLDSLRRLGLTVVEDRDAERVVVDGCDGVLPKEAVGATLDARSSGTTSRFLLPVLALGSGPIQLDGSPQLRARPMADGIAALRSLGVEVAEDGDSGRLPVTVDGQRHLRSGSTEHATTRSALPERPERAPTRVDVAGEVSSQFLSGLLMVAPVWSGGLEIVVDGDLVSRPYVYMTAAVMRAFGAEPVRWPSVTAGGDVGGWQVPGTGYQARRYVVEPDASAASYFFAAAAICGGRVTVDGLGRRSLQGDLAFVDVLERMGCQVSVGESATTVEREGPLSGIEVDMGELSDTAQTLAAVAVFAESPTRVTGIGFIRAKETDRVGNVVRELRRCGIDAEEEADGFVVRPGQPQPTVVATYDDHRMAMSFSLLGLRAPGIEIADPGCVAKTFPDFWKALDGLRW
jgi:3-phosphoshikimate 1-carboxyvinyltransferase